MKIYAISEFVEAYENTNGNVIIRVAYDENEGADNLIELTPEAARELAVNIVLAADAAES